VSAHIPSPSRQISRRQVLSGLGASAAALALSACSTTQGGESEPAREVVTRLPPMQPTPLGYQEMYAAVVDDGYSLPAIPTQQLQARFLRQRVSDPTGEAPGTVVVDTGSHHLYFVEPGGTAMRYGVGLGRAGFEWAGRAEIEWKQKWPRWFPPAEMIDRRPDLEPYRAEYDPATRTWLGGQEPGINNPLGARALYIYQDGKDTLYRLHGSPEWWSIGQSVSSGCVRLINQDIIDLYERVPEKSPILVTSGIAYA
jgi:lipoprotein-anchoring transpeptidase ErfK/SrfK